MTGYPFFFYGLIGVYVAVLLFRKARHLETHGKLLSIGAALTSGIVGLCALYVFFTQRFETPGLGLVMLPATLLSITFWTASLIWAGPPTKEDRLVFGGTIVLAVLMFGSAAFLG
ncbi:MAG: hypothetical protein P8L68_05525 [Paracoccaceae bacterium]|nr:hypothetical protein [Paracoccaceae bacterium]MDG1737493.1 hypothetical protein [Paracoccaceae bacterium]MDG2257935.1 hypothetical protein [Paracoccaceae bacterium]